MVPGHPVVGDRDVTLWVPPDPVRRTWGQDALDPLVTHDERRCRTSGPGLPSFHAPTVFRVAGKQNRSGDPSPAEAGPPREGFRRYRASGRQDLGMVPV